MDFALLLLAIFGLATSMTWALSSCMLHHWLSLITAVNGAVYLASYLISRHIKNSKKIEIIRNITAILIPVLLIALGIVYRIWLYTAIGAAIIILIAALVISYEIKHRKEDTK